MYNNIGDRAVNGETFEKFCVRTCNPDWVHFCSSITKTRGNSAALICQTLGTEGVKEGVREVREGIITSSNFVFL